MASSRPSHSPPPSRPGPAPAPSLASILLVALRPSYSDAATDAALCSSVVTDLEPFEARDADGAVRGVLHRPSAPTGDGAVLAHGAGSNCDSPVLRAVAAAFAARGIAALRIDLPFRQARPKGPPSPVWAPRDRDGLRHALAALARRCPRRLVLRGHSHAGHHARIPLAVAPRPTHGVLVPGIPLHPPVI